MNPDTTKITANEIIELVKSLPDSDKHIHQFDWKQCITTEWLTGNFAGRSFDCNTLEESAQEMIDYLYEHIGHKSMVGSSVTESGFPDLIKVKKYCEQFKTTVNE